MNFNEVMKELEILGTEQNRKIYKRHGAKEPLFGVSFKNLNQLKKTIKKNHELAIQLWSTENVDARILATMIIDPKKIVLNEINKMVNDISYYALLDEFVKNVVFKSSFVDSLIDEWTVREEEYVGRAGYVLLSLSILKDDIILDERLNYHLEIIKDRIQNSKNRKNKQC